MAPANSHTNVSSNGAAGDWYWEVISHGHVIARGLAATEALACAASRAVLAKSDPRPENLPTPCLEDQSSSLPFRGGLDQETDLGRHSGPASSGQPPARGTPNALRAFRIGVPNRPFPRKIEMR